MCKMKWGNENIPVSEMETPTYPNSVEVDISTYFTLLGWTSVELGSGDHCWNKEIKIEKIVFYSSMIIQF